MTDRETGTREQWLAARLELLEAEKELTRRSDELARRRQQLPWVRIDKEYVFDTDAGEQTLRDLFAGRSQLLVYHFMFGPTWTAGCATCTLHAESFDRAVVHLNHRDATMVCVSRAPLAQLDAYKQRMGLTVRWVSSLRSDFNYDFGVSRRPGADPDAVMFNFDTPWRRYDHEEHAGLSAFALEDGVVYHTYSCHLRGLEEFNVTYQLLDRVPRGRDEAELPYPRLGSIAGTNTESPACSALQPPRAFRDHPPRGHIENGTNDQGTLDGGRKTMTTHETGTREEWLAARLELLEAEKELTRRSDELARRRQELPWVKVEKNYLFDSPQGKVTLADLFDGRSQLIVYHFMFHPEWREGCPSCSFVVDHLDGTIPHLAARDVSLVIVSRAPLAKIEAFKERMGWRFRWVSSFGSDFNYDYHVSFTPEQQATGKVDYNYAMQEFPSDEAPGASVFHKDPASGEIFHTYSVYARGLDRLMVTYTLLDLVPKGRDEDQLGFSMEWLRHHDRYGTDLFLDPTRPYWPPTASPVSSPSSISARGPTEAQT